ncbi:MATE family efflux transporter [Pseudoteredinibacter isoporae]|uniref:MATE family multidrug resistance protein n=1 Tax=Pseudoteredinibacter isoporae TaxID=570281 RepID=A0A7X0JRQ7_9GAMM|nr:MATE family efflux transporter [Pseudoteredinibacter isoporae]MBB6520136.1 MATE family multidrug resistance protein [Pseudoteredinibacter isoporae]NHO85708.1 MATE family efflux transporter [Pseudoteredinibacter isoporae]NIB25840.1 MATE family efflux transporter [Pseudoteredinibacter isoporae]
MRNTLAHRKVFNLAIPMLISSISVPLFGLVDTAILGHLDTPDYLAAVAVGASVVSFLLWAFGFLRMGTTSLAARAYGAGQHPQLKLLFGQSSLLALGIGFLIVLFSPLLVPLAVALMQSDQQLGELSQEYIQIRLLAAPAVLLSYGIIGWFIGLQNTRVPLYMAVAANAVNIVGDVVFVLYWDMGSRGAALASLLGDATNLMLGLYFAFKQLKQFSDSPFSFALLTQLAPYRELLQVNRHLFVRTLVLLGSLSFFTAQGAAQGPLILAANAILLQLVHLSSYALDGFAHATEALVGKAMGEKSPELFKEACLSTGFWSLIIAVFIVLLFHTGQTPLIQLFSDDPMLQQQVIHYYPWVLLLPLVSATCYFLDGVFIGTAHTFDMQITMILSSFAVFLPIWWLSQGLGNHGLWLSFCAFNGARGVFLALMFCYRQRSNWGLVN